MNKVKIAQFGLYFPHYREDVIKKLSSYKEYIFHFYGDQSFDGGFSLLKPCEYPYKLYNTKIIKIKIFSKLQIFIIPSAFKSILKNEYDIYILSNRITEFPVILIPIFTKLLHRKIIIWGHGKINRNSRIEYFLRKLLIKYSTAVIFYNDNERNFWIQKGIIEKKLFVARNTVNTETIDRIKKNINNYELEKFSNENNLSNKKVLIFVARLNKEKNPLLILDIVEKLKEKITNIVALVIGDGPLKTTIETKIFEKGLEKNIFLLGKIYDENKIARYFLLSSVCVIPSAVGLSLLHSFSYGVPVVTDNNFKIHRPEIAALKNGENGFICRENDCEDFVKKISLILNDEDLRKKLSLNALNTIRTKYNVNIMANGILDAIKYAQFL